MEIPGHPPHRAFARADFGPPFGHLYRQLVDLVLHRRDGRVDESGHDPGAEDDNYEHGDRAAHPVPGEKADYRLHPDGDEQRQEHEHQGAAHRVHGGAERDGQEHSDRGHEAHDERALSVERAPQPARRPEASAVFARSSAWELGRDAPL